MYQNPRNVDVAGVCISERQYNVSAPSGSFVVQGYRKAKKALFGFLI
jgi:hypothetical protein